ncbi:unnamed protein product, partial [Chrysoparadoxa australica]
GTAHWKWVLSRIQQAAPVKLANLFMGLAWPQYGSLLFRAMGARVGENVLLPWIPETVDYEDLVIGDNVIVGGDTLFMSEVSIGSNSALGHDVILLPGATVGDCTILGDYTTLNTERDYGDGVVALGTPPRVIFSSSVEDDFVGTRAGKEDNAVAPKEGLWFKVFQIVSCLALYMGPTLAACYAAASTS